MHGHAAEPRSQAHTRTLTCAHAPAHRRARRSHARIPRGEVKPCRMCIGMRVEMYVGMCIDMRIGACTDTCTGTC